MLPLIRQTSVQCSPKSRSLCHSVLRCHVLYFLGLSPSFSGLPACSRPLFRVFLAIPIRSVSFRCHLICPVTRPFRVSCLFPSLSSFLLVSLQFSILGSDRSESGSLFSIRVHSCSATIPFSIDLRTLLSFDLMTPVFSFRL